MRGEIVVICRKFRRGGERERNDRKKKDTNERKENRTNNKPEGEDTRGGILDEGQDEAKGGDATESAVRRGVGEVKRTGVYRGAAVLLKSKSLSTWGA